MGSHLSGQLLRTIREECKPPATSKPIVETYLEGSSTFQANGSTEVLEKEGRGVWKKSGKLLFQCLRWQQSPRQKTSRLRHCDSLHFFRFKGHRGIRQRRLAVCALYGV